MKHPAKTRPAKTKSLPQRESEFTAEGAPAPVLPGEAAKAVAQDKPGASRRPVLTLRRQAET